MPERRGGRRKLNITACKHVFTGTNSKGEFKIHEVEAATEQGIAIQDKLTSWVQLPLGLGEFDLTAYMKGDVFQSWTVEVPKDRGGNSGAAKEAANQRIEFLEQQVEWLVGRVSSLAEELRLLREGSTGPNVLTPVATPPADDDIPF